MPKTYFKILQTIPASANEKTKCLQTRDVYAKRSFTFLYRNQFGT